MASSDSNSHDQELIDSIAEAFLASLQSGSEPDIEKLLADHENLREPLGLRLRTVLAVWRATRANGVIEDQVSPPEDAEATVDSADVSPEQRTVVSDRVRKVSCPHCGIGVNLVAPAELLVCSGCGSSIEVDHQAKTRQLVFKRRKLDRFQLEGVLGEGAFGTVYKAWDPTIARYVALKRPRQGYFANPRDRERFLREARTAGELSHPNVVRVFHVAEEEGVPFIVSELIEGVTLADVCTGRQVAFREAAEIVVLVAEALEHAHAKGVVHRDIKPSNILMDLSGRPHVSDFGLARLSDAEITMTLEGEILGTPAYMSPEQATGTASKLDGRSDVYSLGVVLYRLLSGVLPFRGSQRMLLQQVVQDQPKPPRSVNEKVPVDLETIALKAMEKEPGGRYQTAGAMAADLRRWLVGDSIQARPISRASAMWRWCRRYPVRAALAGGLGLALLLAAALGVGWGIRENRLASEIAVERNTAQENARESQSRVVRLCERNGLDHLSTNRLPRSLPWFSEALAQAENPAPEHRLRLGMIWSAMPRLTGVWNVQSAAARIAIDPSGTRAAVATESGLIRILDLTGDGRMGRIAPGSPMRVLRFNHDGSLLAGTTGEKTATIWRVADGVLVQSLSHEDRIRDVRFTSDSTKILTCAWDGTAVTWNVQTGEKEQTFNHDNPRVSLGAFLPGDKQLVTVAHKPRTVEHPEPFPAEVTVWNTDGSEVASFEQPREVSSLRVSEDGRFSVGGIGGHLSVRNALGEDLASYTHPTAVRDAFFRDQDRVLSVERDRISLWKIGETSPVFTFEPGQRVVDIDATQDARYLAIACDTRETVVFESSNGRVVGSYLPVSGEATAIRFLPDDRRFLSADSAGVVRLWDLASTGAAAVLAHERGVTDAHFGAAGKRIVTSSYDNTARIRGIDGSEIGQPLQHDGPVLACDFSESGSYVATASQDKNAIVWDGLTAAKLGVPREHPEPLLRLEFRPGTDEFATGSTDGTVRLWSAGRSDVVQSFQHDSEVRWLTFSPDGALLAVGHIDGTAQVWDVATAVPVGSPAKASERITKCRFSPDGSVVAFSSADGSVFVRQQAAEWQELKHDSDVTDIWFTSDDLLLANEFAGTVRAWQRNGGKWTDAQVVEVESGTLRALAANHNGDVFVTSAVGGTGPTRAGSLVLWSTSRGVQLSPPMIHDDAVTRLRFNQESSKLLSASDDGTARVWSLVPAADSLELLKVLSEVLSGRRIADNFVARRLGSQELAELFVELRALAPERTECSAEEIQRWSQRFSQ